MGISLQPSALVPWKYLTGTSPILDIGRVDEDYQCLLQNEGFEWMPIRLNNLKKRRFESFLEQPDLERKVHVALREATIVSSQSGCDRAHIGSVVATSDMTILTTGFNEKPSYLSGPCDLIGCQPEKYCRTAYPAESMAFGKLETEFCGTGRSLPKDLVLVSNTVPILEGVNICEHYGVGMILFESFRSLVLRDQPIMSYKTIKSDIIFVKVTER